jgi:hypothetical protein
MFVCVVQQANNNDAKFPFGFLWALTPCIITCGYRLFGVTFCFHFQG